VKIYGLDFTSAPSGKKPLVTVSCAFDGRTLRAEEAEVLGGFDGFEAFLGRPGEWVCGMDFPFGQPRDLVAALGWPEEWEGYVKVVSRLPKSEFEDAIKADMARRPAGKKWRYRLADRRSGSSSAMMLFRVPVGKMFYQGAPRLLASGVSVVPCRPTGSAGVAVEAYPAVVARRFLGRATYKRDGEPDTPERKAARGALVAGLGSAAMRETYGFTVAFAGSLAEEVVGDPSADALDSVLCAVQAAWSYARRGDGWGVPDECDRNEGWILDPALLEKD
jgi:hypothetical protein